MLNFLVSFTIDNKRIGRTSIFAVSASKAVREFRSFVKTEPEWKEHEIHVTSCKLIVYGDKEQAERLGKAQQALKKSFEEKQKAKENGKVKV